MENVERLEKEKQERLEIAKMKKGRSQVKNKNSNKCGDQQTNNTKSNETSTGRMENKKRLEGTKLMKSNLWKQRREQDGRLVTVWKEIKKKEDVTERNQPKGIPGTSPQEEPETSLQVDPRNGDQWLEELILTEAERRKTVRVGTVVEGDH